MRERASSQVSNPCWKRVWARTRRLLFLQVFVSVPDRLVHLCSSQLHPTRLSAAQTPMRTLVRAVGCNPGIFPLQFLALCHFVRRLLPSTPLLSSIIYLSFESNCWFQSRNLFLPLLFSSLSIPFFFHSSWHSFFAVMRGQIECLRELSFSHGPGLGSPPRFLGVLWPHATARRPHAYLRWMKTLCFYLLLSFLTLSFFFFVLSKSAGVFLLLLLLEVS